MKEKYDVNVSTVAIHKLVHRTKKFFTPEFIANQMDENQKSDLAIASSLSATLEISMELYEELIRELKEKKDNEGWKKGDFLMFVQVSDRLMRLRQIMFPSIQVSKEISFTKKDVAKEYNVKKE